MTNVARSAASLVQSVPFVPAFEAIQRKGSLQEQDESEQAEEIPVVASLARNDPVLPNHFPAAARLELAASKTPKMAVVPRGLVHDSGWMEQTELVRQVPLQSEAPPHCRSQMSGARRVGSCGHRRMQMVWEPCVASEPAERAESEVVPAAATQQSISGVLTTALARQILCRSIGELK